MQRLLSIALIAFGLTLAALAACDREGDVYPDDQPKPEVTRPWPETTDEPIRDKQEVLDELEAKRAERPDSEAALEPETETARKDTPAEDTPPETTAQR